MKVNRLFIYKDKGKKGSAVKEMNLIENKGVEGDRFAKGGDRQVSVADRKLIDSIERNPANYGPCAARIKANIVTEGCRIAGLRIGDRIEIGDASLEITEDVRICNEDCQVLKDGGSCPIRYGVLFSKVVSSGEIHENDTVRLKMKSQG